jgi:hypothetical protein
MAAANINFLILAPSIKTDQFCEPVSGKQAELRSGSTKPFRERRTRMRFLRCRVQTLREDRELIETMRNKGITVTEHIDGPFTDQMQLPGVTFKATLTRIAD